MTKSSPVLAPSRYLGCPTSGKHPGTFSPATAEVGTAAVATQLAPPPPQSGAVGIVDWPQLLVGPVVQPTFLLRAIATKQ
jgi:hypothetical protein